MVARKSPTRRKTRATAVKKRTASPRRQSSGAAAKFLVPFVFAVGILFCFGFLLWMGYRTVTASAFFDVKQIDVRGATRVSRDEIEKIVNRQTERSGVWNADLVIIREDVEKFTQVKSAVVSRVLPDGLRINIIERQPRAIVRLERGDLWADDDAVLFSLVGKDDKRPPFVMKGWDDGKTDKSTKDNQERVKIYLKMLKEWQEAELAERVSVVDLTDLQSPLAIVLDSGETVKLELTKDNFDKRLQRSLEIIAGRGKEIESISLNGQKDVLGFRIK